MNKLPMSGRLSGVTLVLGSTVVSAATSFLILLFVAPAIGPANYATFSVYWSALYMVIGVLFGIQQESTRLVASQASASSNTRISLTLFSACAAGIVLCLLLATSFGWSNLLFGSSGGTWALPLAIGAAAYVLVASLNGILGGSSTWGLFALLPVVDGLLRISLVASVLVLNLGGAALAWAVAIPFPVSFVIVYLLGRDNVRKFGHVNVRYGTLIVNSGKTMLASFSTAVLVNGFPVVLALAGNSDAAQLGAIILALTLTRAPILVPLTALQSMLITKFTGEPKRSGALLIKVASSVVIGTGLIALLVAAWGEFFFEVFFGSDFILPGILLAGLVASSGALGILTTTGAAVLSIKRHTAFAGGWLVASVISVLLVVFIPGDLGLKTVVALLVGPTLGAFVHLVSWHRYQR